MPCFFKRLLGASLALAMLWTWAAPGPVAGEEEHKADPYDMEVIVRVDGMPITRLQLKNAVNQLVPGRAYHSASMPEYRYEEIQEEALDSLVFSILIYKEAKEKKLDKTDPADIDADIEKIRKRIPESDTLEVVLKRSNMTIEELKKDVKKNIIVQRRHKEQAAAFKKQTSEKVTEPFLNEHYENNLTDFMMPKKMLISNIFIKVDKSSNQRVWNESRKKALELVKRGRAGEDFAELARENSEGPKAAEGGDMGWMYPGSLMGELDFVASAMRKGEISDPLMTIYGYHVLKLEDIKPATLTSFAEINKPKLKKKLEGKEYKRLMKEWKSGLRSNAKVERLTRDLY